MRQVLGRCKALKAHDVVAYFEDFATRQMPENWRTRKKCIKIIFLIITSKALIFCCLYFFIFMNNTG